VNFILLCIENDGKAYKWTTGSEVMLCVVGMPGCGKNVFLTVAREYDCTIISMGDAVRAETKKRGISPENHGKIAKALREEHGLAAIATLVLEKITPDCIVDGVRSLAEIDVFNQHYAVEIVAIYSSPRTRFRRLKKRQRAGDPRFWKEFKERDARELTFGIGDVIALADYLLINESTMNQFRKQCRAFLSNRGKGL
jgi:dephospho-CoA kinase